MLRDRDMQRQSERQRSCQTETRRDRQRQEETVTRRDRGIEGQIQRETGQEESHRETKIGGDVVDDRTMEKQEDWDTDTKR
jgi:hypothetical protein